MAATTVAAADMPSTGAVPVSAVPAGGTSTLSVSRVSALSGPLTRTWSVSHNARIYVVQLYHNTITGDRVLSVDGTEQPGTTGRTTIFGHAATLLFSVCEKQGYVEVRNQGHLFEYVCKFDDMYIPEDNSLASGAASDDTLNRLKVSVDSYTLACDESGKNVVWFGIRTVRENDERETVVHRRFNNFVAINDALRGAYTGSQLLGSFPDLPPRGFWWDDQTKPEFLEKRRFGLSDWLHKISHIPRMRLNPDFLAFVGIVESSREASVVFTAAQLGLTLRDSGTGFTEISGIKPLPSGEPSPVQQNKHISVGYTVSKISGENVIGDSYDVIIAKLKSTPRPMMVHFIGAFPPLERAEGEEAASFAKVAVTPAPAPAPEPITRDTVITGLIGGDVSYIGTGATPLPPSAAARTGLSATAAGTSSIAAGGTGERGAADGIDSGSGIAGGMAGVL